MLRSFSVTPEYRAPRAFNIFGIDDDDIIVENIDGLDPGRVTIYKDSYAAFDDDIYQSSRRGSRAIDIRFGFNPDFATSTVSSLRNELYDIFALKSNVTLQFDFDDRDPVTITAVVEGAEGTMFSNAPTLTVSLWCNTAAFAELDAKQIVVSTDQTSNTLELPYSGDVTTGVDIQMTFLQDYAESILIENLAGGSSKGFSVKHNFLTGDILSISTVRGRKRVVAIRDGSEIPLLYSFEGEWLEVVRGPNFIRVSGPFNSSGLAVSYRNIYGGI